MDPTAILTIIGLAIAIYAIIPRERRLDLSFRISLVDWMVVGLSFILIHYIIYFSVLNELGLAVNLGPWKWGFNEEKAIYFIFLILGFYLFFRIKTAKMKRSNTKQFGELFEQLLQEQKYWELLLLTESHIDNIIKISNSSSWRNKLAKILMPYKYPFYFDENEEKSYLQKRFPIQFLYLANKLKKKNEISNIASNILRRLLNNPEFVKHLSSSRPYLGVQILTYDKIVLLDFLRLYIYALIENKNSIYYYELEHTINNHSNHGFSLSESNKLLYFLFSDVHVSKKLEIYKPVGDKVCEIINYDKELIDRYNEPLGTYDENGLNNCPINSSLNFFNIMISQSLHQGITWHMWLYYFREFTRNILDKLAPNSTVDLDSEWPTPFHCLIYRMVKIMLGWLDEYQNVKDKPSLTNRYEDICKGGETILESVVMALGNIVFMIVSSQEITDHFKIYIIDIVMRYLKNNNGSDGLSSLRTVLMKSILRNGNLNVSDVDYLESFKELYERSDPLIRYDNDEFNSLLEAEYQSAS